MTLAIGFQTYRGVTVPNGESRYLNATGDYVVCYAANHDSFDIAFEDGAALEFFQGAEIKIPKPNGDEFFSGFRITNTGASALVVSIGAGFAEFRDRRLTVTGGITLSKAANVTTAVDQTVNTGTDAEVLAANTNRREALVQNLHATASVRVLEAAAANRGIRIGPGETWRAETTAAIRVRNDSGSNVNIAVMEVED